MVQVRIEHMHMFCKGTSNHAGRTETQEDVGMGQMEDA